MYTVRYIHRRPALTVPFFADAHPQVTKRLAGKVRRANGFGSQTSEMSADKLVNTVTVIWKDQHSADGFNAERLPTNYRRDRMAYDAKYGTTTEIQAG